MSDLEFPMPASEGEEPEAENVQPEPTFDDAFSSMEAEIATPSQGRYVQLRNGGNAPRFVPLQDEETSISIAQAVGRAGITVGVVEYWVDNARVNADYVIPEGGVVEIIGNVKGGTLSSK